MFNFAKQYQVRVVNEVNEVTNLISFEDVDEAIEYATKVDTFEGTLEVINTETDDIEFEK